MSDGEVSVRVAVRVRPFNDREKLRESKCIIDMQENQTWITNPDTGEKSKPFAFDYSYWSHDAFKVDDNGITVPDGPSSKYSSQQMVFNDLGRDVLDNAWKGYNCSLFAYGQTGSGKSYSMVGYGKNKGIIPITCETLFTRIAEMAAPDLEFRVTVSMIEVYNEQVRDLLNPKVNPPGGLKLRQSPAGVFIESLQPVPVVDYADIESKMELGTQNRTVAATQMNQTSSRAHTVFTIMFQQINKAEKREQLSKINLIDLAGSERADSTGATGDRLKEGCAINLSLTCLGNVISALADLSMGKKGVFVPYRNSVLTRLLQDALGGNSKTIMICALSPASINYEETASTLKYAERAKRIKNKAVVNENPTDKMIRELKEENDRLKKMLTQAGGDPTAMANMDPEAKKIMEEQISALQSQIEANQRIGDEMAKSWEQKLADAVAKAQLASNESETVLSAKSERALDTPHFLNLHEDTMLTCTIMYLLRSGVTTIGNRDAQEKQDIVLHGLNIQKQHGSVTNEGDAVTISAVGDARIFVNGQIIRAPQALQHGDRVIIGNNWVFVFCNPLHSTTTPLLGFQDAVQEMQAGMASKLLSSISESSDTVDRETLAQQAEFEKKLAEMQEKLDRERKRAEAAEANGGSIENFAKLEEDMKKTVEETKAKMAEQLKRKRQVKAIEIQLASLNPNITEANSMAREMNKPVKFEPKLSVKKVSHGLSSMTAEKEEEGALSGKSLELVIRMNNLNDGNVVTWSADKFESRLFLMRDLYREFCDQGFIEVNQADDPFWDPPEPVDIGTCFVYTRALTKLVEISKSFQICSRSALQQSAGKLEFSMFPLDIDSEEQMDYLDEEDDPFKCLLNQSIKMHIEVGALEGLPDRFANNVFVTFSFMDQVFETIPAPGFNVRPKFSDSPWTVRVGPLSNALIALLQDGVVHVEVKGYTANAAKQLEELEKFQLERKRAEAARQRAEKMMENMMNKLAAPQAPALPAPSAVANLPAVVPSVIQSTASHVCSHCEESSPHVECVECAQPYCTPCFSILHKAPSKRTHQSRSLPAATGSTASSPCQRCEEQPAVLSCSACAQLFCAACDQLMHKAPSRAAHARVPVGASSSASMCEHCEEQASIIRCTDCQKSFCQSCCNLMHKAPSKQAHNRIQL